MILRKTGIALLCILALTAFCRVCVSSAQEDEDSAVASEEMLIDDILSSEEDSGDSGGSENTGEDEEEDIDSLLGGLETDDSEDADETGESTDAGEDEEDLGGLLEGSGDEEEADEEAETPSAEAPAAEPVVEAEEAEETTLEGLFGGFGETGEGDSEAGGQDETEETEDTEVAADEDEDLGLGDLLGAAETEEAEEEGDQAEAADEEMSMDDLLGGTTEETEEPEEKEESTQGVGDEEQPDAEETAAEKDVEEDLGLGALLGETPEKEEESEEPEIAEEEPQAEEQEEETVETEIAESEEAEPAESTGEAELKALSEEERMQETARKVEEAAASIEKEILQDERDQAAEKEEEPRAVEPEEKEEERGAVKPAPRSEQKLSPELANVMTEEELRRVALERYSRESMLAGEAALGRNNFEEAVKLFRAALDKRIPRRPETEWVRQRAREGLRNTYYQEAQLFKVQEEYEKARASAQKAANRGHEKAAKLIRELKRLIEKAEDKIDESRPADYLESKEFRQKEQDISNGLRVGRRYLAAGEYSKAEYEFEQVLDKTPDNTEAIRLLAKVAREREDRATMERETTRDDMMSRLIETWNPRDYAEVSPKGIGKPGERTRREPEPTVSARTKLIKKMEEIEIPEITFRQANINDVVDFLSEASIEYDRSDDEHKGVNIILQLGKGRAGSQEQPKQEDAGDFGLLSEEAPGAAPAEGSGAEGIDLITFNARYISLWRALDLVADVADLRVEVEENIVKLVPSDTPRGDIIVRWYSVLPSAQQKIATIKGELVGGGGGGGGGGGFAGFAGGGAGGGGDQEEGGWKEGFAEMGVEWPDGSSIKYVGSIGRLIVGNTARNLAILEQILAVINVVPYQIEIEARFVEVRRGDLNSLGFEWLLTDNWEIATNPNSGSSLHPSSQERLIARANDKAQIGAGGSGFTRANRFVSEGLGGAAVSDSLLTVAGVLTNPELEFILHAMEQRGYADMLSAPKVTTQAGHAAEIKVVTEYIYPTDFTVTPVVAGDGEVEVVIGGIVEPSAFETREVGVILGVTPEVSEDGQIIDLTMTPEVVTEPTWRNYGSSFIDGQGNEVTLNMEQPFFHTRTVATRLSIYNGATVVMGGMMTENRDSVDDKIPVLGDIPLVGRLFRSKYDRSDKRNLLIFVTAKLVDPAGKPLTAADDSIIEQSMAGEQGDSSGE